MKNLIILLVAFLSFQIKAQLQLNTDLLGHLSYDVELSDIWGYVDETGKEYALVGKNNGVSIVDVTNPSSLREVFSVDGPSSIWRDLKVWGDYAYVTNETDGGLLIIDLRPLPQSSNLTTHRFESSGWTKAHNLYIDENGICYIFGANRGNGGVIMYDLKVDPIVLQEVGEFDDWYVHDGMARGDTLYLGHINDGFFSVVNVSDKSNPVLLGTKETSVVFTHNVWVSDDGDYLFTTDERSDAFIGAYDISDLTDIEEIDLYQSSDNGVIPHNVHYLDGFLVTSYYRDGLDITDVSRPHNIIRVGAYDTADDLEGDGFNGAWGAYPYLPSKNILVSDIEKGLYVIDFDYEKACYFEGRVTEAGTGRPLNQVAISVSDFSTQTNINGEFNTGTPSSGNYNVTISRQGYVSKTIQVSLNNGELTERDVELELDTRFTFVVEAQDEEGQAISDLELYVYAEVDTFYALTNDTGFAFIPDLFSADLLINTAKWGYKAICNDYQIDVEDSTVLLTIEKQYYDDFSTDLGWTILNTAERGAFTRETPNPTFDNGNSVQPGYDAYGGCFEVAYVSGNANTEDIGFDDIDDAQIALSSPIMDLSDESIVYFNFYHWLYLRSFGDTEPNDSLLVFMTNGEDSLLIKSFDYEDPQRDWEFSSIRVDQLMELNDQVKIHFVARDKSPGHLFEVGIDMFSVSSEEMVNVSNEVEEKDRELTVYPNPVSLNEQLNFSKLLTKVELFSAQGALVRTGINVQNLSINGLKAGMYVLRMELGAYQQIEKIVLK